MRILADRSKQKIAIFLLLTRVSTGQPNAPAKQAFDWYAMKLETRLAQQHSNARTYLAVLDPTSPKRAERERELRSGNLHIEAVDGGVRTVAGGLVHHWRGAAFVPEARADDMLALLGDYPSLVENYSPQVESCRLIRRHGDADLIAIRLQMRRIVRVVLDSSYEVRKGLSGSGRGYGISRSTRVRQVDDAGTDRERVRAEGADDGFLWGLNSYWSFAEVSGGLMIELEAISLTRDIPVGFTWLALPFVQQVPRQSLEFTLQATRTALTARASEAAHR